MCLEDDLFWTRADMFLLTAYIKAILLEQCAGGNGKSRDEFNHASDWMSIWQLWYIYRLDNAMHAFLVSIIFCLSITPSGWDILNNPQLTCWQAGCWPTRWFQKLRKRLSQQQKLQQWWLGWLSLQPLVGLDYCLHSMSCLLWEIWSEFGFLFVFLQKWKTKINMIIWTSRWWFVCSKKRAV